VNGRRRLVNRVGVPLPCKQRKEEQSSCLAVLSCYSSPWLPHHHRPLAPTVPVLHTTSIAPHPETPYVPAATTPTSTSKAILYKLELPVQLCKHYKYCTVSSAKAFASIDRATSSLDRTCLKRGMTMRMIGLSFRQVSWRAAAHDFHSQSGLLAAAHNSHCRGGQEGN
jgi:hypothetical protein